MVAFFSAQFPAHGTSKIALSELIATSLEGRATGPLTPLPTWPDRDVDWDMSDELDFVPSSQPYEDGEEPFLLQTPPPSLAISPRFGAMADYSVLEIAAGYATGDSGDASAEAKLHRSRLVRRAPPVEPRSASGIEKNPPRHLNLVRRVTKEPSEKFLRALELERKRQRARQDARRITKKIQALTRVTARLQREHQRLRALVARSGKDKENLNSF
ncbi:hypothetical protein MSAN_00979500 [Mycena sanguinolenta]|uniref:Uncharacterized protein n=1 Tax=Mycena sanguinolenta TaxID=230812 RepID=A0A8H7DAD5_9AGAR|nr:hypothetical protein MSAN_00979500 [Mycena sanguinolenta]